MLLVLLACTPSLVDSGGAEPPRWQGTQIGEEGDEPCSLSREPWDSDQGLTPDTPTPAELRSWIHGEREGLLSSAWQGSAPLQLDADAESGGIFRIYEEDGCGTDEWLAVETHLRLDASPLLTVDQWADLRSPTLQLSLEDAQGELDPGVLPDDASELELIVNGDLRSQGTLQWLLRTDGSMELAEAAIWTLD